MKTVFAGLAVLAAAVVSGCAASGQARTGTGTEREESECAATRDVSGVVVRLRDMGWSAQHTIDAVLFTSQIRDEETQAWFVGLVSDIYSRRTSLAQIDSDYAACMKALPSGAELVRSRTDEAYSG